MGHNIYAIMKTMCPPGYHHNGFVGTHALGIMTYKYHIYIMYIYIYIFIYIYIYIIQPCKLASVIAKGNQYFR